MMHLLIGAEPGLLSTFFSLVKKRFCSPELKHCLNVYSVVLCMLGMNSNILHDLNMGNRLMAYFYWKTCTGLLYGTTQVSTLFF